MWGRPLVACLAVLALGLGCGRDSPEDVNAADATATTPAAPSDWLTFSQPGWGYAFRYPPSAVVVEDPTTAASGASRSPVPLHRVRLQDAPASSQTAHLQPPLLSVEVFMLAAGGSFEEWLRANVDVDTGASRTPVLIGRHRGQRVQLDRYIAPGVFYYLAPGRLVYKLTPLGELGQRVLASFEVSG